MLTTSIQVLFWVASSRDQGRILMWATVGACAGVYLFFRGFKMLQFKRLIQNTPTSKVRSASMGLVEVNGMAVGPRTIPAAITGDPCFYYRATAWEHQRSGSRGEWRRVADESLFVPFFIQDETGTMLVNAQGADMDVHRNFKDEFGGSLFSGNDMPMGTVGDFLLRTGLSGKHVRLEEYCIKPDNPLFVLGTLGENSAHWRGTPENHVSSSSSSINLRWNSRPRGNGLLSTFGGLPGAQTKTGNALPYANQTTVPTAARQLSPQMAPTSSWSSISMDEVERPVLTAKISASATLAQITAPAPGSPRSVSSEPTRQGASVSLADMPSLDIPSDSGLDIHAPVAIGRGSSGDPFTISSESQRELVSALVWKSTACIWGGPALTVACVYVFLLTLGWI